MKAKIIYPFTAIVGQERLKKALLLCAINPAIGGLLIQGDKGTAKSTAARALAAVLPKISSDEMNLIEVPFINLPLGATEERVLGSLDLEAVLVDKKKKFQPGLLAAVHQGILYIDEVNLLTDHLVDVLLDVAAMGENIIEREGLSLSHPSRFTLIGTMNPEEGQLRPQFLDRFGLMVHVDAPSDVQERTEVVRRRISFEQDPLAFCSHWQQAQHTLIQQVERAKELLPSVQLSDALLTLISQLCADMQVRSLRADIVMYKTAITIAAVDQRVTVTAEDIQEAADLALLHRRRKNTASAPQNPPPSANSQASPNPSSNPGTGQGDTPPEPQQEGKEGGELENPHNLQQEKDDEQLFQAVQSHLVPKMEGYKPSIRQEEVQTGKRSAGMQVKKGLSIGTEKMKKGGDLAIGATVLNAVLRNPDELNLNRDDLQQNKRSGKTSNLILFVVDASGSMAASKRMEAVKGTVLSLLADAYQKRDTVGVIAFRGIAAQVLLTPTRSIALAEEAMQSLPTGGRTPLPHALQTAIEVLNQYDVKQGFNPILVVLTDGKANVSLEGGGDAWHQTIKLATELKHMNIKSMVLNSDLNYLNLGKAEELAGLLGGEYLSLNNISEQQLTPIINQVL